MSRLPSEDRMFQAFVEGDVAMDGVFMVAVKTTGIFCRCTCPARKPRRENVEFFASVKEAMLAGYRACKRCRPMDADGGRAPAPAWVNKLKRLADEQPVRRIKESDLRAMGLDPSTVRRVFKARFGMSFQAYARARRMGMALRAVREGKRMNQVQQIGGYASESGFREAFGKLFGSLNGKPSHVVYARWIDTPLGAMLALADDAGLRVLDFVDRRGLERHIARVRDVLGRARGVGACVIVPGEHAHLLRIEREVSDYFAGRGWLGHGARKLAVPLAPIGGSAEGGTAFQREVWAELQRVPLGETRSYAQQARAVGKPRAIRAVARANGENYLGLVIPCHRVIGADGTMIGYGGGVWRKQWLLEHEARMAAGTKGKVSA